MPAHETQSREYAMETVERAEHLYCVDGQTFEAVATLTGVSASTLKRWSDRYGWQEKRERLRQARSSARANLFLLHANLLENCLKTLNAQDAFAVAAIESLVRKAAGTSAAAPPAVLPDPENLRSIRTEEDAVAALEEALEIRVNRVLADPGAQLNVSALKDIKQVMDLLRDLKARCTRKQEAAPSGGLTPEAAEAIRRNILGIKT